MYTALYLDDVRNDILNAKQWYAKQQDGLGERFVLFVKEAVTSILKMPSAFAIRYRNVRIAHTKKFPYNIHFFIDEEKKQIIFIGVIHQKRKDALSLDR
jgi:hypothetical protein